MIAKCYKLHGFPPGFFNKAPNQPDKQKSFSAQAGLAPASIPTIPGIFVEQRTQLMALLRSSQAPDVGIRNIAYSYLFLN